MDTPETRRTGTDADTPIGPVTGRWSTGAFLSTVSTEDLRAELRRRETARVLDRVTTERLSAWLGKKSRPCGRPRRHPPHVWDDYLCPGAEA